jgi:hypothetical protein
VKIHIHYQFEDIKSILYLGFKSNSKDLKSNLGYQNIFIISNEDIFNLVLLRNILFQIQMEILIMDNFLEVA